MAVWQRHIRLLYLLALFQLLGGPLVLGGFMLAARLMVEKEVTLTQSLGKTMEHLAECQGWTLQGSEEFLASRDEGGLPGKSCPPKPPLKNKTPDSKSKLWALDDLGVILWRYHRGACLGGLSPPESRPTKLANAPPVPPPRLS